MDHRAIEARPQARERRTDAQRRSRVRLSITQKLVALIVLTTGAIVVFLGTYFPEQQIRASRAELEEKAATYGRLVSHQVASAVAFDDRATAREVFDSLAQDDDVMSLVLFRQNGSVLHRHGTPGAWMDAAKVGVEKQQMVDLGDRVAVVLPVVSLEGPRGTLAIELSTRGLKQAKARIARTALLAGSIALSLGALFAYLIARSLGQRIGRIARTASAVAAGDLDQQPAQVGGSDEISVLAEAFNAMLAQIRSLLSQIKQSAQEEQARLEELVSERTRELDRRNGDMRMVLDHVGQGFLSVDLDGRISEERSAIVETWFGKPAPDALLFDYLDKRFTGRGEMLRLHWENLREDWMPIELRIDQLPKELESQGAHFGFEYNPVYEGDELRTILLVISDVTALVEKQRAEEEESELVNGVRCLIADRSGFLGFLSEAEELVLAIFADEGDRAMRMRLVHTLKGNSAIFGFASIARQCHALEDKMVECGEDLSLVDRQRLRSTWARIRERIGPFVTGRRVDALDVQRKDYQRIVEQVATKARHSLISTFLESWKLEPVEGRLRRVAEYAYLLADRLGKSPINVRIEANDVRLDANEWTDFWKALVHVVRNAVDHGLDTAEEREQQGKLTPGLIVMRATLDLGRLTIEVEDNGRGIDWGRVAELARSRGLPATTRQELTAALFHDELSTRESVSATSGRGVGLGAVREVCKDTGGEMSVLSAPGKGTTFRFVWFVDEDGLRSSGPRHQLTSDVDQLR